MQTVQRASLALSPIALTCVQLAIWFVQQTLWSLQGHAAARGEPGGVARVCAALLLFLSGARPPQAAAQDPSLDNLVHDAGYATAEPRTLGAVVERGEGPLDMVLVSGFGVGASAFEGFLQRNSARYRMLALTLPGFEGSAAPPMPAPGTSYGAQSWTNDAVEAVARLIRERGLERPILVGHYVNGTQVAARVALEHPELARALVLLAGTPRYEPVESTPYWPRGMTLAQKVVAVDGSYAPRWFKTVTRQTWVAGNFVAGDYSLDAARGKRFADLANSPPLPVLIRWLCEYHASDLGPELARLTQPLLLIQPAFTAEIRADEKRAYLPAFFDEPWKGVLDGRPHTRRLDLEGAGILLMDDEPAEVDRAIAEFVEHEASADVPPVGGR